MVAGYDPGGIDATLVLVRHGESEWITRGLFQGQGNSLLTTLGRRQAALVAGRLANAARPPALPVPRDDPATIVHSPLDRAAATADAIAAAFARTAGDDAGTAIPRRADPGFLEIGQGEWEGLPAAVIAERWPDLLRGWRQDPPTAWAPGGESLDDVDARVRPALGRVLVELGAVGPRTARRRTRVLGYVEEPNDDPWAVIVAHDGVFKVAALALLNLPLARFWMMPFALCGITVIELREGEPHLRLHNATDHLVELETEAAAAREAARTETGAL
jgi:broad specificity phosphatase PhoE